MLFTDRLGTKGDAFDLEALFSPSNMPVALCYVEEAKFYIFYGRI